MHRFLFIFYGSLFERCRPFLSYLLLKGKNTFGLMQVMVLVSTRILFENISFFWIMISSIYCVFWLFLIYKSAICGLIISL